MGHPGKQNEDHQGNGGPEKVPCSPADSCAKIGCPRQPQSGEDRLRRMLFQQLNRTKIVNYDSGQTKCRERPAGGGRRHGLEATLDPATAAGSCEADVRCSIAQKQRGLDKSLPQTGRGDNLQQCAVALGFFLDYDAVEHAAGSVGYDHRDRPKAGPADQEAGSALHLYDLPADRSACTGNRISEQRNPSAPSEHPGRNVCSHAQHNGALQKRLGPVHVPDHRRYFGADSGRVSRMSST